MKALVTTIDEMRNPFLDDSRDLLVLDFNDIVNDKVVERVRKIESIGDKLHSDYVEERLVKATTPISHPLSNQQLSLFSKNRTTIRSRSQFEAADHKGLVN